MRVSCQLTTSMRLSTGSVVIILSWLDVQVELLTHNLLINSQDIFRTCLEMTRSIITLSDKKLLFRCVVNWLEDITDLDEKFFDGSEEGQSWFDFFLWVRGLYGGGDHGDTEVWSTDGMRVGYHRDVHICKKVERKRGGYVSVSYQKREGQKVLPEFLLSCF